MVFTVPNLSSWLSKLKKIGTDDWVDRLNYYFTTWLLLFFALMISAKQYFGSPMQCWVPAQWKGGWEQYAEDYCFVSNTYNLPLEEDIPSDVHVRQEKEIGYYQWVPIMLTLQALCFFLPNFIWTTFSWQSGINLEQILKKAKVLDRPDATSKEFRELAIYLQDTLGTDDRGHVAQSRGCCWSVGSRCGAYVTTLYLFVKLLYVLNAFVQFFALNNFLDIDHHWWGTHLITQLLNGDKWVESKHFPRVTMCDLSVRVLGQTHRHTIQCVIMINMFNEKIYLFLWFWIVIVAACTLMSFIYHLLNLLPPAQKMSIHRKLRRGSKFSPMVPEDQVDSPLLLESAHGGAKLVLDRRGISLFTSRGLKSDGVLTMRFIAAHAGELIASRLLQELYMRFDRGLMLPRNGRRYPPPPSKTKTLATAPPGWGYNAHNSSDTTSTSDGDHHHQHHNAGTQASAPPQQYSQDKKGYHETLDMVDTEGSTLPLKDANAGYPGPPMTTD